MNHAKNVKIFHWSAQLVSYTIIHQQLWNTCFDVNMKHWIHFFIINKLLSYFAANDTNPYPYHRRFSSCDKRILVARNLSNYLSSSSVHGILGSDKINHPGNVMILIYECPCKPCSRNQIEELIVMVCVNGKPKKFKINECKTCPK